MEIDKSLRTDERGQVGISFLIIFIALVLVAAVAAGLFIESADVLQQQASSTSSDAQSEVSNQLEVVSIYGHLNDTDGDGAGEVQTVTITVEPAAGANAIDLSSATIDYYGANNQTFLTYGSSTSATTFNVTSEKDRDGSVPVLNADDDVQTIHIDVSEAAQPLNGDAKGRVRVNTASGGMKTIIFEVPTRPPSSGTITLR